MYTEQACGVWEPNIREEETSDRQLSTANEYREGENGRQAATTVHRWVWCGHWCGYTDLA